MPMPKYAARRDTNDPELAKLAMQLGAKMLKFGPFDYWCGRRGVWHPVEIKLPEREGTANEYTPLQRDLLIEFHQRRLPMWIWRTKEDVIKCLNPVDR